MQWAVQKQRPIGQLTEVCQSPLKTMLHFTGDICEERMPSHLCETLYECFRILYRFPVLYSVSEIRKKALGSHLQYHAHTLSISIAR